MRPKGGREVGWGALWEEIAKLLTKGNRKTDHWRDFVNLKEDRCDFSSPFSYPSSSLLWLFCSSAVLFRPTASG